MWGEVTCSVVQDEVSPVLELDDPQTPPSSWVLSSFTAGDWRPLEGARPWGRQSSRLFFSK